jgi:nudix-type nucleoside diphosphatase (YffH/AdpP family)
MPAPSTRDRVRIRSSEILYKGWSTLKKVVLDYRRNDGRWERQTREVVDHGHGAAVLPYDADRGTVLLVRQFRYAAFDSGHAEPLLEACAGLLDDDRPEECARREAEEELGYRPTDFRLLSDPYMSPGSLAERVALFTASYQPADKVSDGGGRADETEDIEIVEMALEDAYAATRDGRIIDAKTIILIQHLMLVGKGG